jgi:hypothetical protein
LRALEKSNPRDIWKRLKYLTKSNSARSSHIEGEQWISHFNGLLNNSSDFGDAQFRDYVSSSLNIIEQSSSGSSELNEPITIQELNNYIQKLKRGKSSGIDSVTNEMILDGGEPLHNTILNI